MSGIILHTARERLHARRMAVEAAALALHHAPSVHYTQGSRRWEGIDKGYRAYKGQYPKYADCSSFVTWCLWQPGLHWHLPDFANGEGWEAGYTGTLAEHGVRVTNGHFLLADVVLYGSRWPYEHTALLAGAVDGVPHVISHGSEGGPYFLRWDYRPDAAEVRRFIR
jgi:hypothetical protein